MKIDWRSKKLVLVLIAGACAVVFVFGMAAAWHNRHHTICPDGKVPVAQLNDILGQTEYKCHDGRVVTTS